MGHEMKLGNGVGIPFIVAPFCRPFNSVVALFLAFVLLGMSTALAEKIGGVHVLRVRYPGQDRHYLPRWPEGVKDSDNTDDQSWNWKMDLPDGLGFKLHHRDSEGSPFTSSKDRHDSYGHVLYKSLKRDDHRIEVLNSKIEGFCSKKKKSPSAKASSPKALQAPVVSGLNVGSGEYFTVLQIGSPATSIVATIDTGSDLFWIQCHPCDSCYTQVGSIFNPAESSTYDGIACYSNACESLQNSRCSGQTCLYQISYGDGSFTVGDFAKETLTLNTTTGSPFKIPDYYFGCGHDNEGVFVAAGGLLGLGQGPLSFPSQLSKYYGTFSYCLVDRFSPEEAEETSFLYFGGKSQAPHLRYTNLTRNPAAPTFYYVELTGISVGKKRLKIPVATFQVDFKGHGGVILDSGTSITRLQDTAYVIMRDEYRARTTKLKRIQLSGQPLFDTCYEVTQDETVPLITLHFADNVDMILPINNILIPVDSSGIYFCLAFASSGGPGNLSIIGNVQQQDFYIEYDLKNFKVGFAPAKCAVYS